MLVAYDLGVRHFGENRVEEASVKLPAFKQAVFDPTVVFHIIGHIQSRKAEDVAPMFNRVHSVDSVKLAQRLARFALKPVPILLEVMSPAKKANTASMARGGLNYSMRLRSSANCLTSNWMV